MKILIIEDEATQAAALEAKLCRLRQDIDIAGCTTSIKNSIAFLENHPDIDIIFSDIKIDDGLSFSVFDKVQTEAMVVFITAFDEYALKAFDYNCADYILKPVSDAALERALTRCESRFERIGGDEISTMSREILHHEVKVRKRLFLQKGQKMLIINVEDICYITTERGYTKAFLSDGNWGIPNTHSLLDLAASLDKKRFFRANRQTIVNIEKIKSIDAGEGRNFIITLDAPYSDTEIPLTTERRKILMDLLIHPK